MKKQFKIVMFLLSFICILSLAGCTIKTESDGHFFRASWGGALQNLPDEWLNDEPVTLGEYSPRYVQDKFLISDKSTVDELFSETYSQSYSEEERSWVRDETFTNLMNKFNEEYFENNQIVCFFLTASAGNVNFKLINTTYYEGVLTIEIKEKITGGGTQSLVDWFAIVEVEKVPSDTLIELSIKSHIR